MIIDFHTHVFPERIAAATVSALREKGGIPAYSDGTMAGLVSRLFEAEVDLAVNLPVLTKPTQLDSICRFASEKNSHGADSKIISFVGMHPDIPDVEGAIQRIKAEGFLGIKIHPDYQETFFDDERYIRILASAKKEGLITVTHAGPDVGYVGKPVRCTPRRVLNLLDKIGGYDRLVLAHLGGNGLFEEVYSELCGRDIYLDTAFAFDYISEENFKRLLDKHGDERVLFASDSPWGDISKFVKILKGFCLGEDSEKKIFSENARSLLGI